MSKRKYLPLYYKWMERGSIPKLGLCNCFPNDSLLELLSPESSWFLYWANEDTTAVGGHGWTMGFNQVRQNIVLFMAAMNNEL